MLGVTMLRIAAEHPEVGGPEEDDQLVLDRRGVQGIVDGEACEAKIRGQTELGHHRPELEHRRAVGDRAHARLGHLVDVDAAVEVEAAMVELHLFNFHACLAHKDAAFQAGIAATAITGEHLDAIEGGHNAALHTAWAERLVALKGSVDLD